MRHIERPIGLAVMYVLHFFSGRRRERDVQYWFEAAVVDYDVNIIMLSIDVANDSVRGDLGREDTVAFWVSLFNAGKIAGALGGPPCETWSPAPPCGAERQTPAKAVEIGIFAVGLQLPQGWRARAGDHREPSHAGAAAGTVHLSCFRSTWHDGAPD